MRKLGEALLLCIIDFIIICIAKGVAFAFMPYLSYNICDLIGTISTLFIFYILYDMSEYNLFKVCKFRKVKFNIIFKAILIGICIPIISQALVELTEFFLRISTSSFDSINKIYHIMLSNWLGIFNIVILGTLCEEILCRGIMLRQCLKRVNHVYSIIIQAIFFGLLHGNIIQFIYTFVLGIILGYTAYYTKSLIPSIIIHIFNNSIIFVPYNITNYILKPNIFTILVITSILIIYYLLKTFKKYSILNNV